MKDFGTEKDYIMTKDLNYFTDYDEYDMIGIEYDLRVIKMKCEHLSPEKKQKVIEKYKKVIEYIRNNVKRRKQ